jgi:divinyl protochlorophyllide a 8-vinyl-reductase
MAAVGSASGCAGTQPTAGAVRALIGPNAITQVADALLREFGAQATSRLFEHAGLAHYLTAPPTRMVDDADVQRLHAALRSELGVPQARRIGALAGRGTGDYLLAHRIPALVQVVLKRLPAALAARVLMAAIRRHAWTFTGAGSFSARSGMPWRLSIRHGPLARDARLGEPVCDFYVGTFERLFSVLVHPQARVVEVECEALGDSACVFELRW